MTVFTNRRKCPTNAPKASTGTSPETAYGAQPVLASPGGRRGRVAVRVHNPNGGHHIAAGLDRRCSIDILGHAGYFVAGMNQQADVTVQGNVGWSVAENMMSGTVRVRGCASECVPPDTAGCW